MNVLHRFVAFACALLAFASAASAAMTLGQAKLGNVFVTTDPVAFPITGMTGTSVAWTATDYFGAVVGSGTVPVSAGAATIQPNLDRRGWFELHLRELNGATLVSEKKTLFAVLTPISVAGMGDSPFGAQTHFAQSTPTAIMPLLARAGIAHFRDEQYWDNIESPAGTYTYPAKFTNYMAAAAAEQLQPLITLDWANRHYDFEAGQFTGPHTDNGRLGYANYALNLLDRYGSQMKFVEVWNEYNAGTFIKGPATANKSLYYHLMLKQTYEAIKAVRPDVQVLAGATVPIAHGFFRNIFEQGAMPYVDAISVHPYRGYAEGVDLELAELRDLIRSYNGGETKPIWASEFSLNVDTAAKQKPGAAYLARIVTLMRLANVERMYYYLMQDDGSFPFRGLLQSGTSAGGPYVPNPAYVAYATIIRQLYGWTPVARVGGTAGTTHVYQFTKDGETLHVLWANAPTTLSLATASEVTVTELMGQESVVSPSGGHVALPLTSDVIYVRGPVTAVSEGLNPVVADSVDNYSKTQGTHGWYYGYANLSSDASYSVTEFQPMSWGIFQSDNTRWLGTSTFHFMGQGNAHPASAWAIRRWISDRGATMRLTGTAVRGSGGDGVGLRIFVDGVEVHTAYLNPDTSASYDVTAAVNVGSTIDFAITQGLANNTNDSTSFTARLTDLSAWTQSPPAPTALSATSGDLQVTLSWTGSTVATSYDVKRATVSGGPYTTIATPTGANYTDTTLEDATMYHYVITAANAHGESTASNETAVLAQVRPVASASQQQTPNETADKAFDGLTNTKWYTGGAGSPRTAWLQYFFGARGTIAKTVIRYDITSANDSPTRDPRDWQFQGSHNGVDWITLDTRTGQAFSARFQTKLYVVSNTTAYPYYRLNITANNGATTGIQLAELGFVFGQVAPTVAWPQPAAITYGTPLGAAQLNATASVPGAFAYTPPAGTVLDAGADQPLAVVFTPSDAVNYTPGTASTSITVEKAPAAIVLGSLAALYDGSAKPVSVATVPAGLATHVIYDGQATSPVYPGEYDVRATIIDPNHSGTVADTLVITTTAIVRHAPTLSGILDGSVQVLRPESVTLKETASLAGDLLVPGRPTVITKADPMFVEAITVTGPGAASPTTHTVTVNAGAVVRYVVVQVDALELPDVPAPTAPAGTRSVMLSKPGQSAGDFATLRNLMLNGGAGFVAVAPGAYGHFLANGGTGFVLGVPGATEPARYDFQSLTLNGASTLQVVGPVIVTLANGTTLNGQVGEADHPDWLTLQVKNGGLTLNTGAVFDGHVIAPAGTVTINEQATLRGSIAADYLTLNHGALLADPDDTGGSTP